MRITKMHQAVGWMALSLALAAGQSQAQVTATTAATKPPEPQLSDTEQAIKDIKNPTPWLSWGSDLRIRNEYLNNTLTLTPNNSLHEQDYFRFRGRLWTSIKPLEEQDLSFNARLASEPREWINPAGYSPMKGHTGLDMTEGIVDNLYVQWKNILEQPANLTVGRQDILLGDGWLVGDGTPGDGSWTYFLDSARLSYEFKEQHTTVEAIGIMQDRRDDGWMPVLNSGQHRFLTEQNEKGAILNIANTSIKEANLTGYFIYKTDQPGPDSPRGADDANIYTLGARVNGLLGENWKYWVEGAYQLGEKRDGIIRDDAFATDLAVAREFRDINAYGVNSRMTYLFKDPLNNQLTLSYEFLSGDDPSTKKDEMFDLLWGRWPRWSEIGLYSVAGEARIGSEGNLHRLGPTWTLNPTKKAWFSASYYALFSEHDAATRAAGPGLFSGDGNFRGHFLQAILKYQFNQHLNAHLWSEFQFPGDYYVKHSMWSFLRAEIYLTF